MTKEPSALVKDVKEHDMVAGQTGCPVAARGTALLVALIFLALFASLAVGVTLVSDMNMTVARNRSDSRQAAAMAETGVFLIQRSLAGRRVSGSTAEALHAQIAAGLMDAFAESAMMDAADISSDSSAVALPTITIPQPDGRTGTIDITISADGGAGDAPSVLVTSTGRFGDASHAVFFTLTTQSGLASLGTYGILSKSPIAMSGSARILGVNNDQEGSILCAADGDQAVSLSDSAQVSGNVAVCNPEGTIQKSGSPVIGGDEIIGAAEPTWPDVDVAMFEQYVESNLSGSTSGTLTWRNIRIPAGTNPTFTGNSTFRGVVYIEAPNRVKFDGTTTIRGIIVAEAPAVDDPYANRIEFNGPTTVYGVETLPTYSCYEGLRDQTGTFLLAPGRLAQFNANVGTIGGSVAAGKLKFTTNARATFGGRVLNLAATECVMEGNSQLSIDLQGASAQPAGLSYGYVLVGVRESYRE
jgi:hypothetical protein